MSEQVKLKTLENIEEARELFARQLEEATKSDGDWLKGRTIEDVVAQQVEDIAEQFPGEDEMASVQRTRESVSRLVEDYAAHKGEAQLFFINELVDTAFVNSEGEKRIQIEIVKIWESELVTLIGLKYKIKVGGLPSFVRHTATE